MQLPFFYIKEYNASQRELQLDEDTSRHIIQVLRMKKGRNINLTDGKGNLVEAEIIDDHKKHCEVRVINSQFTPAHRRLGDGGTHDSRQVAIAISLLKNTSRFEWFLEKATEIGVSEIIPLICERTEKEKFRFERMQGICISAMLQSQQVWLPVLHEPAEFMESVSQVKTPQKFIAYCDVTIERTKLSTVKSIQDATIFIGPEGDFTNQEIDVALRNDFTIIELGQTRLRTETAGIIAAAILKLL